MEVIFEFGAWNLWRK